MLIRGLILMAAMGFSACTSMLVGASPDAASDTRPMRSASTAVADNEITAAVESKLDADGYTGSAVIDVDTFEGRVTLRGVVPSYAAREQADRLAKTTAGVVKVNNELAVRSQ